jgi:hypothetical protein
VTDESIDWQKLTADLETTMNYCARISRETTEMSYWVDRDDEDDVADWHALERRRALTVIDGG